MPTAQHAPQAVTPRILPECSARCASGEEPRSSFACPRPAVSPFRACPPPLACSPPVKSNRMRSARPPLSATAANAAPTARVACGCPSGQRALFVTRPAACVLRAMSSLLAPSQASRSAPLSPRPASLRSHRAASVSGCAFALLSPPRACPLHFSPLRAWRRADSAPVVPLPPLRSPLACGANSSQCSPRMSSEGARRRSLATPRLGGNFAARFACPLARNGRARRQSR